MGWHNLVFGFERVITKQLIYTRSLLVLRIAHFLSLLRVWEIQKLLRMQDTITCSCRKIYFIYSSDLHWHCFISARYSEVDTGVQNIRTSNELRFWFCVLSCLCIAKYLNLLNVLVFCYNPSVDFYC